MLARTWSAYQSRIFEFGAANQAALEASFNGKKNGIVIAVAGSGKSTTLEETARRIGGSYVALVFGRKNAAELKGRGMNARTFHSLTFGAVLRHKRQKDPTDNKLMQLCDANLNGTDQRMYGAFIRRLVSLAKNAGIGCLEIDSKENWLALIEHHGLELDSEEATLERAVELACALLEQSNASPLVDFDDMLYIAVRDGLSLPKFDFVLVDEAQDTNAIQRALIRKIMQPHSRVIFVGDPAQAIYGFRGADANSMEQLAEEFDCIELPLTVSYRCPKKVVEYARKWVSHIEAAPGAAEGTVRWLDTEWNSRLFQAGDLIVCRTTKPLVTTAYQLIKARVPCAIMGRDLGRGLVSLVNKMNAKGVERLIEKLHAFTSREVEKCIAKKQDAKAETLKDRLGALLVIIDSLSENDRTVPAVIRAIEALFSDERAPVTLSTIHRAKGLESERVFWLNRSQCPSNYAKKDWQLQQEHNLCYVAATRAKAELVLIEERRDEQREVA